MPNEAEITLSLTETELKVLQCLVNNEYNRAISSGLTDYYWNAAGISLGQKVSHIIDEVFAEGCL